MNRTSTHPIQLILIFLIVYVSFVFSLSCPTVLEKFVDRLPLPRTLPSASSYSLTISQISQKLHRDLPRTVLWGIEGSFPGPTIEARTGSAIRVTWKNRLPNDPLIPTRSIMPHDHGHPCRIVIHLHGGKTRPESDGHPQHTTIPGHNIEFTYDNDQPAALLWYHDHTESLTRVNVYSGISGLYILRDDIEDKLDLPEKSYEIPLVIQDRVIDLLTGQLVYPYEWPAEMFGDTVLVNGVIYPYVEVKPRIYRFRVVNGCNSRFFNISLSNAQSFYQIGSDGGFFNETVTLKSILLSPGERADLLIDFSSNAGETIELLNDANAPFPNGDPTVCIPTNFFQFRVSNSSTSCVRGCTIPNSLVPSNKPDTSEVAEVRDITLSEAMDDFGTPMFSLLQGKRFRDPIIDFPVINTTEIWRFINLSPDSHPMHLHLVHFYVLDRTLFDVGRYVTTKTLKLVSDPIPAEPSEFGPKDTVRVDPNSVTRILVKFSGYLGDYVYHCHILEHEDNDMMRPFRVIAPKKPKTT